MHSLSTQEAPVPMDRSPVDGLGEAPMKNVAPRSSPAPPDSATAAAAAEPAAIAVATEAEAAAESGAIEAAERGSMPCKGYEEEDTEKALPRQILGRVPHNLETWTQPPPLGQLALTSPPATPFCPMLGGVGGQGLGTWMQPPSQLALSFAPATLVDREMELAEPAVQQERITGNEACMPVSAGRAGPSCDFATA